MRRKYIKISLTKIKVVKKVKGTRLNILEEGNLVQMFEEQTEDDDDFDLLATYHRGVLNKIVMDDNVMDKVEMLEDD